MRTSACVEDFHVCYYEAQQFSSAAYCTVAHSVRLSSVPTHTVLEVVQCVATT